MMRRPPGEGRSLAFPRKVTLALALIFLPWLVIADAQQQPSFDSSVISNHDLPRDRPTGNDGDHDILRNRRHESPLERGRVAVNSATSPQNVETLDDSNVQIGRKNTLTTADEKSARYQSNRKSKDRISINNIFSPDDASALATLAPDQSVRAPPSPQHVSSNLLGGAAGLSPQSARSLEKWEVEDYVLLATVDGHLYAVNRESGDERWHLEVEQPVVETVHHRTNRGNPPSSYADGEDVPPSMDDYIWAVEPTHNGPVYVWVPSGIGSGLRNTGLTMKQLVDDFGPYAVPNPNVVYTGDKKTTMITLDATTGRVIKYFGGQAGSDVDKDATCFRRDGLDFDGEECINTGTITLSRTEYTVSIHGQDDGRSIATLKYSEWGPNNFDADLHQQYHTTRNNQYFTSQHDGRLYAVDQHLGTPSLALQFPVPVARVFDIARPRDTPPGSNPDLVLLPQPTPPPRDEDSIRARSSSIFLNQTESGSWYAMSGMAYPLILNAPAAQINKRNGRGSDDPLGALDDDEFSDVLKGTHYLDNVRGNPHWHPSIPKEPPLGLPASPLSPPSDRTDNNLHLPSSRPEIDLEPPSIVDKVNNIPTYVAARASDFLTNPFLILIILYTLFRYHKDLRRWYKRIRLGTEESEKFDVLDSPSKPAEGLADKAVTSESPTPEVTTETAAVAAHQELTPEDKISPPPEAPEAVTEQPATDAEASNSPEPQEPGAAETDSTEKKPAKKAHRGKRGGVKHRKGAKKQESSESRGDEPPAQSPEEVVEKLMKGPSTQPNGPQPDVMTVLNDDMRDVNSPIIKIRDLEVNQNQQLGIGSNGTVVYAGTWFGRQVAVKRMLNQFYDIASQETKLLLESDNHSNVIQYFAHYQTDHFLYIALELCQASLADVIEKPFLHKELAQAGERDLPAVLLQITRGLGHLHDLRIVHRDLKPQNILVTMYKGEPRLLVSDFGLCKKLEGGQSSFGATTAHAAGTSGWRAPELLLDDDAREGSGSMASAHSESSQLVSSDLMPNRRATRAIDIFSLGLVFFYVLTKGSHPFDCGDRYMREVNIRKGHTNLRPLEVLGDTAFEAQDLIGMMLQPNPKDRPSAKEVMSHPFFWNAKKRLDFLVDVSDHFEREPRDPPSEALQVLETFAPQVCRGDFLKALPKDFVESLGKQRKYTGSRLLDLLRALRNKRNHYDDMSDQLKRTVGPLPDGYLGFWTRRFPDLLIVCCTVIYDLGLQDIDRFKPYSEPA